MCNYTVTNFCANPKKFSGFLAFFQSGVYPQRRRPAVHSPQKRLEKGNGTVVTINPGP